MESQEQRIDDLEKRIQAIESQLSFLKRQMGLEADQMPSYKISQRVMEFIQAGNKIEAIKEFRQETGASLKDAKTIIENQR